MAEHPPQIWRVNVAAYEIAAIETVLAGDAKSTQRLYRAGISHLHACLLQLLLRHLHSRE